MEIVVLAVLVRHVVVHVSLLVMVHHRLPVVQGAHHHVHLGAAMVVQVAALVLAVVVAHQAVVEVVAEAVQVAVQVLVVVAAAAIVLLHVLAVVNGAVPRHAQENAAGHHVAVYVLMFVTEASVMVVVKVLVNLLAKARVSIHAI